MRLNSDGRHLWLVVTLSVLGGLILLVLVVSAALLARNHHNGSYNPGKATMMKGPMPGLPLTHPSIKTVGIAKKPAAVVMRNPG